MPMIDSNLLKPLCDKAIFARQQFNDACENVRGREATKLRDPGGYARALGVMEDTMGKFNNMNRELAEAVIREVARLEREAAAQG